MLRNKVKKSVLLILSLLTIMFSGCGSKKTAEPTDGSETPSPGVPPSVSAVSEYSVTFKPDAIPLPDNVKQVVLLGVYDSQI